MTLFRTDNLRVEQEPDGVAVLWLDESGATHNVFNRQVMAELDQALDAVAAEPSVRVLVVRSAKPAGFLAGADLHEFTAVQTPEDAMALSAAGQRLFDKMADLRVPVVAVIHGPCLGGGLEFALACDYRLVIDQPGTQLGLPEVELGLLPGWGGTQRLPRVVGLERALQMILAGKRLSAREAQQWGLADSIAASEDQQRLVITTWLSRAQKLGKRRLHGLPLRTWRQRFLESTALGRRLIFGAAERSLRKRVPDDMPAPKEALDVVRVGIREGMQAGLAAERAAAGRLALTPACRHLVGVFLLREKSRKLPPELQAYAPSKVTKVGIVGAGVMGAGIAQLAALRGCEVYLQEVNEEALGRGIFRINELFEKAAARGVVGEQEYARAMNAIHPTLDWKGFETVEVVVEAAVEDLEVKKTLFRQLVEKTKP